MAQGTDGTARLPVGPVGHTPGPWRVEDGTTLIWGDCNPDDPTTRGMGYPVAEARVELGRFCNGLYGGREFREGEAEANARLIASAPDMADQIARLEAIKAGLLEAIKHARSQIQHPDQMIDEAIERAEAK